MQLTLILFPIALAIYGAIIYLFVLLVKALRKYIKSKDVREEKKAVCRSLGEALKTHRTEKQMTQEFVAETLGVSRQAVSKWENGEFPIVKDTTPNMMNPRLYTTSYNKPQGQQFDDTAVLSFIKLQYT